MNAPFTNHRSELLARHTFRLATMADADAMIVLSDRFFSDSEMPGYGLSFDPVCYRDWLERVLPTGRVPHILAFDAASGELIGYISYFVERNFTDKPFANMEKFFVRPDHRRSTAARVLLTLATAAARSDGASLFLATVNSGIHGGRNVFNKLGFHETPFSCRFGKEL